MGYLHLLFLLSFSFCQLVFSSLAAESCPKDQSIALIEFKQKLIVDESFLSYDCNPKSISSWNMSRNCCLWDGVTCDKLTGHVIELDLSCSLLVGTIDSYSSLFQLSHLQKLNLSLNNFSNSQISPRIGTFSNLIHLDLSQSYFSGQVPSEISHLSKLQSLNLYNNELRLIPRDFKLLLMNLTQLRDLNLVYVNISSTFPLNFSSHITTLRLQWTGLHGILPESIFHLPNLEVLSLTNNDQLSVSFPKTKWNSSASLTTLELSLVTFVGNLPESLGYLTSLQTLLLPLCNLSGPIPKSLWNLTSLEYLNLKSNHLEGPILGFTSGLPNLKSLLLSNNSLNGAIPPWIFSLPSLRSLDLSLNHLTGQLEDFKYNTLVVIGLGGNKLQGHLPKSIQNLVNLTDLDLSSNNFSGHVDVSLFSNLNRLFHLDLSYNNIVLTNKNKVKSTLPESLEILRLAACEVNGLEFLRSAKQLNELDLSNNKIQGKIPDWAWSNWELSMSALNLSYNMLTSIDNISIPLLLIDLRYNFLQGLLPIPPPFVTFFFISNNNLSGEIPSSICNLTSLVVLDLARNNLMGAIPQCLGNMSKRLEVLDMQQNSLSGNLQTTFSFGSRLKSFNLHGNKLEGQIPRSLANCEQLEVLDLGNNHLDDTFPVWLGTLPKLQVFSLRSNKLHGSIRTSRLKNLFPHLQILDLSGNAFTAELPTSLFQNLKAMRRTDNAMRRIDQKKNAQGDQYYQDSVIVVTKGITRQVVRILSLYTTIDLSDNKFEGQIPNVLGDLISLRVLNLSHNGLQGRIPSSLGKLSVVESLDLSFNKLSGKIPQQLASLTFLSFLNLSHNHLEGCIPEGPQLDTFENSSYQGNDGLRGFPVSEDCGSELRPETNNTTSMVDEEDDSTFLSELSWKVVLMGYGCGLIVGFSIAYFMYSSRNPNWLSTFTEKLENKIIIMIRRKKQRDQRHCRRRNN